MFPFHLSKCWWWSWDLQISWIIWIIANTKFSPKVVSRFKLNITKWNNKNILSFAYHHSSPFLNTMGVGRPHVYKCYSYLILDLFIWFPHINASVNAGYLFEEITEDIRQFSAIQFQQWRYDSIYFYWLMIYKSFLIFNSFWDPGRGGGFTPKIKIMWGEGTQIKYG